MSEFDTIRYIGTHASAAGGLSCAVERVRKLGGTALQLFTRNQRQWNRPQLDDAAVKSFKLTLKEWGDYPVASHDSYLINLASPDREQRDKSIQGFADELIQCARLGIRFLVTHPGAHKGQGQEKGLATYADALDSALDLAGDDGVTVLLETTAGQGTSLGGRFEDLGAIISLSRHSQQLGVCFDTCHVFAAGYDLRSEQEYMATFAALDKAVGLERLMFFHLNDSKGILGSGVDRHEHIGKGELGLEAFRLLLWDQRFRSVPMVLETPKDKAGKYDRRNLRILRKLAGKD